MGKNKNDLPLKEVVAEKEDSFEQMLKDYKYMNHIDGYESGERYLLESDVIDVFKQWINK